MRVEKFVQRLRRKGLGLRGGRTRVRMPTVSLVFVVHTSGREKRYGEPRNGCYAPTTRRTKYYSSVRRAVPLLLDARGKVKNIRPILIYYLIISSLSYCINVIEHFICTVYWNYKIIPMDFSGTPLTLA